MIDDNKQWFYSKTIWAGIVTVLVSGINFLGYTVDPEVQAGMSDALVALVTAGSGLVAIYGRVRASKTIAKKP